MPKSILIAFNILIVAFAAVVGLFISLFFLGNQDTHQQMIEDMPLTFIQRFVFATVAGLFIIGLLTGLDCIMNRTILKANPINIKKPVYAGLIAVTLSTLLGCMYFFRILE